MGCLKLTYNQEGEGLENCSVFLGGHLEKKVQSEKKRYDYMPGGLTFNSYTSGTENLYKYNGKEEQKETQWLDYGARMYMPDLLRWGTIDPLADAQEDFSPYHYVYGNPILYNDPTGMIGENSNDDIATWVHNTETDEWLWIDDGYHFQFDVSNDEFEDIKEKGSIKGTSSYGRWFALAVAVELGTMDGNEPGDEFLQMFYDDYSNAMIGMINGQYGDALMRIGAGKLKMLKKLARYIKGKKGNVKVPGTARGGQTFENKESKLPKKDANGKTITYKKYDVNPAPQHGSDRGAERMIVGSDGKAYYTRDHYKTFTEVKH